MNKLWFGLVIVFFEFSFITLLELCTLHTLTSDHVYDGLVQADRQICGVLFTRRQLEEERRLVYVTDLLVDIDVQHGGLVACAVPAEEVHVGEDLLELLLLHLVVLEVDYHGLTGGQLVVQRQLEAVHQLDVSAVLFADEGPEYGTRLSVLHTPSQNTDKCEKYCIQRCS